MNDKTGGQAADALMGIFGFKRVEGKAMDKVSETRRGLFEAWAVAEAAKKDYKFMDRVLLRNRTPDSYRTIWVDCAWAGFNAALDAVEIELPEYTDEVRQYGYSAADVHAAIESTGLGLRIK